MNVCKGPLSAMCGEMCSILSRRPRPSPLERWRGRRSSHCVGRSTDGWSCELWRRLAAAPWAAPMQATSKKTNDYQGANQKNSIYRNKQDNIYIYIHIKGHNMNQRYRRLSDKFLVTCESNPSQPEISRTFAARVKRSPLSPTLMFNTSFSTRIWRIGFLRLHKMIMLVLVIYEQWEPR